MEDSPEPHKTTTTTSNSSANLESSIFNCLSDLSPFQSVRRAPVSPGYPFWNSPPVVFRSPNLDPSRESKFRKRLNYSKSPGVDLCNQDDREKKFASGKSWSLHVDQFISRHDDQTDERTDAAKAEFAFSHKLDKTEVDHLGKSLWDKTKIVDSDREKGGDETPSIRPKVNPESSCERAVAQMIQEYKDCLETTTAVTSEHVENVLLFDSKAIHHHRGMHRHCLQFGEAKQQNILMNHFGSWNPSNITSGSNSPPIPSYLEALLSYAERSSNFVVSEPSGVGLHLNSNVNAEPVSCGVTENMRSNCNSLAQASVVANSFTSLSPQILEPLDNDVILKQSDSLTTTYDKWKSHSESGDTAQELKQLIPKKKRKAWSTNYSDGCKRCNCKKTSCLKLYCDCFAAGIYCVEPCACQGCYNRLEYEDTVLGIRQQIESRNPLAFAPKIADESRSTPTSARHKRGCNCKKSMCLKKYCECYQANVGCSDGCRCERCKNVYGRKEEYDTIKDVVSKGVNNERLEGTSDEKLKIVANTNGFLQTDLCNSDSLTPSLQGSDHGQNASKSCFPKSGLASFPPYGNSPRSPINLQPSDEFTPLFDVHGMHHLAAVPDRSSMAMASSASSVSSLCWRSSPIIPMTKFDNAKQAMGSDNAHYDVMEDDTPDILKNTFTHPNNAKVRSPNKKRVSPPRRLA